MECEDTPSTSNKRYETLLAWNSCNANTFAAFDKLTISPPSCVLNIQNGKRETNSYLNTFAHNTPLCLVLPSSNQEHQWILDSGASLHFTHDINDFIDYRLVKPIAISTATAFTNVIGKGTVILRVNGNAIRISPVWHVPEMTAKLISLGQLFKGGLHSRGNSQQITVYTSNNEEFLTFLPRKEGDTIFTIQASIPEEGYFPQMIYKVDFETMHRRLAHPSNEVL